MPTGDSKLDAFESLFRSAVKEVFHYSPPTLKRILVLTDLDGPASETLKQQVVQLLSQVDHAEQLEWEVVSKSDWASGPEPLNAVLELVQTRAPDLIVTYRHLLGAIRDAPYTVGSVVDTLTQATNTPLLLLPPLSRPDLASLLTGTAKVMVVTDHLTGNDDLVNWGVKMCFKKGTLFLAHVEDDATLKRYLDVIGKLPELDTDTAAVQLSEKLLHLPTDYIESVAEGLRAQGIEETVVPLVRLGHTVKDYQQLMAEHNIDLLCFNTKDEKQEAMTGMAHALAVEIRHRPLLLL